MLTPLAPTPSSEPGTKAASLFYRTNSEDADQSFSGHEGNPRRFVRDCRIKLGVGVRPRCPMGNRGLTGGDSPGLRFPVGDLPRSPIYTTPRVPPSPLCDAGHCPLNATNTALCRGSLCLCFVKTIHPVHHYASERSLSSGIPAGTLNLAARCLSASTKQLQEQISLRIFV